MASFSLVFYIWIAACIRPSYEKDSELSPNIVGGSPCSTNNFPFMISIRTKYKWRGHLCGGTLIRRDLVLTAAHCIEHNNLLPSDYVAVLYTSKSKINGEEYKTAKTLHIHPKYHENPQVYDVGMMKLKLPFSRKVTLVALPPAPFLEEVKNICPEVLAMGWGATQVGDYKKPNVEDLPVDFDGQLRCVVLPILNQENCKQNDIFLNEKLFCTMPKEGGADACTGDSGGPLMCNKIQYGIVPRGFSCGLTNKPSFNIRIDRMLDFIEEVYEKSSCCFVMVQSVPFFLIVLSGCLLL